MRTFEVRANNVAQALSYHEALEKVLCKGPSKTIILTTRGEKVKPHRHVTRRQHPAECHHHTLCIQTAKDAKGNHSSAMGVCRPTSTTGGWERKIGRPSARVDSSHDRANSNPDHDREGHIGLHHTYDHMLLEVA